MTDGCPCTCVHRTAEASRDKSDVGRRAAERRAKTAEEDLAAFRERWDARGRQVRQGDGGR